MNVTYRVDNSIIYIVIEGSSMYTYDFYGKKDYFRDVTNIAVSKYKGDYCLASNLDYPGIGKILQYYLTEKNGELLINEKSISDSWRDEGDFYERVENKTRIELDAKYYGSARSKEPAIGMTANEVEDSTWGFPIKINKRTFSWGTSEQWVYLGQRYIYFENGIVIAISEQ